MSLVKSYGRYAKYRYIKSLYEGVQRGDPKAKWALTWIILWEVFFWFPLNVILFTLTAMTKLASTSKRRRRY